MLQKSAATPRKTHNEDHLDLPTSVRSRSHVRTYRISHQVSCQTARRYLWPTANKRYGIPWHIGLLEYSRRIDAVVSRSKRGMALMFDVPAATAKVILSFSEYGSILELFSSCNPAQNQAGSSTAVSALRSYLPLGFNGKRLIGRMPDGTM